MSTKLSFTMQSGNIQYFTVNSTHTLSTVKHETSH